MLKIGIGCLAYKINLAAHFATSIWKVADLLNKVRKSVDTFRRSPLPTNVLRKR